MGPSGPRTRLASTRAAITRGSAVTSTVVVCVALPTVNAKDTSAAVSGWNVVKPIKENAVDPAKATVADNLSSSDHIYHKNGLNVAGLNALFGDGHVRWQDAKANPNLFNKNGVWAAIDAGTSGAAQTDIRYLMYSWQP